MNIEEQWNQRLERMMAEGLDNTMPADIVELAAAMDAFQEASPEVWYGDGHKHVLVFHDVYAPSRGYERQGIYFCNCGYLSLIHI